MTRDEPPEVVTALEWALRRLRETPGAQSATATYYVGRYRVAVTVSNPAADTGADTIDGEAIEQPVQVVFRGTGVRGTQAWRDLCEQGYVALNAACPDYAESFAYEPVTGGIYRAVHHAANGDRFAAELLDTGHDTYPGQGFAEGVTAAWNANRRL